MIELRACPQSKVSAFEQSSYYRVAIPPNIRDLLASMHQFRGTALAARGRGTMVFVGSIGGLVSVQQQAAYGSVKAALHHLVRCSAHELGPRGVRVDAVAPGFVRTPRLLKALAGEFWDQVGETNPLGRVAIPADIASAILFLCSDLASYVTGNVLTLDGGAHFVPPFPELRLGR